MYECAHANKCKRSLSISLYDTKLQVVDKNCVYETVFLVSGLVLRVKVSKPGHIWLLHNRLVSY